MIIQLILTTIINLCPYVCDGSDFFIDSIQQKRFDEFAIGIINQIPNTKDGIINKYGKPKEIQIEVFPDVVDPSIIDTATKIVYDDFVVSLINNNDIQEITIKKGNRLKIHPTFCNRLVTIQEYFGYTNVHTNSSLFYCIKSGRLSPLFGLYFKFDENGLFEINYRETNP